MDGGGDQPAAGRGGGPSKAKHHQRKKHVGRRTRERDFLSANVTDGEELGDLELMNWIGGHSFLSLSVSRSLAGRVERSTALQHARVRAFLTASPSLLPPASH